MLSKKKDKVLYYARCVAVVAGIAHLILMTLCANGPELAPLTVFFVDYPAIGWGHWIAGGDADSAVDLVVAAIICSFVYPAILYYLFKLLWMFVQRRADKRAEISPNG